MKFSRLALLALFCVFVGATDATSPSDEEYWRSIWPNTPMPKNLQDLLKLESGFNVGGKVQDTQYPSTFFFENELQPGKQMKLKFNKHAYAQPYTVTAYIENIDGMTDANSIERKKFSMEELCEKPRSEAEVDRICAKSLESLVDFVISKLGKDVEPLSSSLVPQRNYIYNILEGVHKVAENGLVICHRLNFPNVVFYCHQVNATSAYTVPLAAPNNIGTETKALAICHHDTRGLNHHILYHQLKIKPGTVPFCHFLGSKALLWAPNYKPVQAI